MTWRGQGFADALAPTGVLLGFALVFGLLAVWRFKVGGDPRTHVCGLSPALPTCALR